MDDDKRKIKDQIEQNIELFFEQNHQLIANQMQMVKLKAGINETVNKL